MYSVLVHNGDVHGGHYYAYVRPTTKMQWLKFDDERVTKARKKEVFENTFGGETQRVITGYMGKKMVTSYPKTANACIQPNPVHFCFCSIPPSSLCIDYLDTMADMLLYIRDSDREQVLVPVEQAEIPSHLEERFEQEEAEKVQINKQNSLETTLLISLHLGRQKEGTSRSPSVSQIKSCHSARL